LLAILDEVPLAVWFAFGVDLDKYIEQVHAHNKRTGRKTFIFVIVHSVEDVRRGLLPISLAYSEQGRVGIEAGGHGRADAPPLFVLLKAVLKEMQSKSDGGPLVLAAGGISTGTRIASLLTMGADGVVLGTRFLFTPECEYSDAQKKALVQTDLGATVRTITYDEVGRTNGWPPNFDGWAISNQVTTDY
ncbi:Nitronate monooxygenase-domain-containing protein, partial [Mycena sp. CBHHK59/15]